MSHAQIPSTPSSPLPRYLASGREGPGEGAQQPPPLLQVENLGKRFGGFAALSGISLAVAPGERLGLIGPNGSGKSTFVNCLCGALANDSGQIHFDGRPINGLKAHQRTRLGIARSFQLPHPFTSLTVAQNLRIPLLFTVNARLTAPSRTAPRLSEAAITQRSAELLQQFGLAAKAQRLPRELTQVEMRKLELARAMATEPKLLVADEALAGLSHSEIDEILALLMALNASGVAIIFIEHIMRAVMIFAQRLAVFVAGQKIADGDPATVIAHPEVERAYLG